MNKFLTSILLTSAFAASAMAAPNINFSDNSKTFLKERKAVDGYRTKDIVKKGLMKKNSLMKNVSKAPIVKISSEPTNFSEVEKTLIAKNYHIFDKTERIMAGVNYESGVKVNTNILTKDPQLTAEALLASVFPKEIAKQFDFLVMDTEVDELEDGTSETSQYVFNYHRVLNNRVVRGKDNITIYVSVEGIAEMVIVDMSNLEVSNEYIATSDNDQENSDALEKLIAEKYATAYSSIENTSIDVRDVNINGVAEAYCLEEGENVSIYQPCLSYSAEVILDNGDSMPYIFDAPYSSDSAPITTNNNASEAEIQNGAKILEVSRDMVAFELKKKGNATITFSSANGSRAARFYVNNARAGYNVARINASKIPHGRYTVTVEANGVHGSKSVLMK